MLATITATVTAGPTSWSCTSVRPRGVGLYPTDQRDGAGALLAIATWGPDQGHLEQLVVVGSGASAGADPAAPAVLRRVGPVAEKLRHPQVGPDGHTVVFESSARSFRDLYRLDLTGPHDATPVRLTDSPHGNFEPALAPDGARVAFASSRDGNAELRNLIGSLGENPSTADLLALQQQVQQWTLTTQVQSTVIKEVADALKGIVQKAG